jgi:hypothetical protein
MLQMRQRFSLLAPFFFVGCFPSRDLTEIQANGGNRQPLSEWSATRKPLPFQRLSTSVEGRLVSNIDGQAQNKLIPKMITRRLDLEEKVAF